MSGSHDRTDHKHAVSAVEMRRRTTAAHPTPIEPDTSLKNLPPMVAQIHQMAKEVKQGKSISVNDAYKRLKHIYDSPNLKHVADSAADMKEGKTPLMHAASLHLDFAVEALYQLTKGSPFHDPRVEYKSKNGWTALMYAVAYQDSGDVKPDEAVQRSRKTIEALLKHDASPWDLSQQDSNNVGSNSAVGIACSAGNLNFLKMFFKEYWPDRSKRKEFPYANTFFHLIRSQHSNSELFQLVLPNLLKEISFENVIQFLSFAESKHRENAGIVLQAALDNILVIPNVFTVRVGYKKVHDLSDVSLAAYVFHILSNNSNERAMAKIIVNKFIDSGKISSFNEGDLRFAITEGHGDFFEILTKNQRMAQNMLGAQKNMLLFAIQHSRNPASILKVFLSNDIFTAQELLDTIISSQELIQKSYEKDLKNVARAGSSSAQMRSQEENPSRSQVERNHEHRSRQFNDFTIQLLSTGIEPTVDFRRNVAVTAYIAEKRRQESRATNSNLKSSANALRGQGKFANAAAVRPVASAADHKHSLSNQRRSSK